MGNMGCVPPGEGYLEFLRSITSQHGTVLIFDEVMTGFRLSFGGAQQLYKIKPDLTTLGKIIGGGLPVGAYGGRAELMDMIAPLGPRISGRNALRQSSGDGCRNCNTARVENAAGRFISNWNSAVQRWSMACSTRQKRKASRLQPIAWDRCLHGSSSPAQSMTGTPPRNPIRKPSANSIVPCWNRASTCRHRNMKPCS